MTISVASELHYNCVMSLLRQLSPEIQDSELSSQAYMCTVNDPNYITVLYSQDISNNAPNAFFSKISVCVGMGTLVLMRKISHEGKFMGLIEDVVVDSQYRNQGIGREIINELTRIAKEKGAYKVVLRCDDENEPFYEKLGFNKHKSLMRKEI